MSVLPSDALAPLPAALAPAGWRQSAACRFDDRDLFFPAEEERAATGRFGRPRPSGSVEAARGGECLGNALTADERHGVWGGTTAEERERLRRGK